MTTSPEFERFWSAYPRKKSKGDAFKAWRALERDPQLLKRIVKAAGDLASWHRERGTDPKYIPYPATWLRAWGWEDELEQEERSFALPPLRLL